MAKARKGVAGPTALIIRSYNVGFGDCFLLSFQYTDRPRHVLIDFGSTRKPNVSDPLPNFLPTIAKQIATDCDHKLTAVVATHRHKDHISGFERNGETGPGAIIAALKPDLVVQPWTEDPKAARDAIRPTQNLTAVRSRRAMQVASLRDMRYAEYVRLASRRLRGGHLQAVREQLEFLGEDNQLANPTAVRNLAGMARNRYVYFGSASGLDALLPGVKTRVLGPPTVEQTGTILKERSRDANEFWQLRHQAWA